MSALIVALHRVSQEGLPLLLVGAGLPQIARLAGEAKSYAERLFQYPAVGPLDPASARQAIEKPIFEEEATIAPDALGAIVDRTKGYPFFLQGWASVTWDGADGPAITLSDVEQAYPETLRLLDQGFFKVWMDRLTKTEIMFVRAMATLGDGPYAMADIAAAMRRPEVPRPDAGQHHFQRNDL